MSTVPKNTSKPLHFVQTTPPMLSTRAVVYLFIAGLAVTGFVFVAGLWHIGSRP